MNHPVKQHPVQAILLMLVSVFFMSTMDVVFKMLVEHYASFQVVFLRCIMSLPLFAGWILLTGHSQFRTAYSWGYLPGWRVWIGASVIVLSGLFILYRENRLRLKQLREQAA